VSEGDGTRAEHHLIGITVAVISAGLIIVLWNYGLDYLNGTLFEELRYVVFAIVAVGLLSGVERIFARFTH
jgi:hypothetical protein